jgi:hypothetical protein
MPVEAAAGLMAERQDYTHLEAFGRLLAGMAPCLELGDATGATGKKVNFETSMARSRSLPDYRLYL